MYRTEKLFRTKKNMPKPMTIIDELWCIYHVLLRQNMYVTCFFSFFVHQIKHPILKLRILNFFTKMNGFIFKYLKIGFFGKNKSACQFWKSVLSKSKQTTKIRICRFRIGCCIWWNCYKKTDHAIPVLLNPGRYLNPSKKQKKTEKKNPIYIFSSKSIFSPRYVFISKIQERKKNDWSLQNNLIIVLRLWQTNARNK